jgi:hypothetical protein
LKTAEVNTAEEREHRYVYLLPKELGYSYERFMESDTFGNACAKSHSP